MIRNAKTACKYFAIGLLIGLLFAPRSGPELRQEILKNAKSFVTGVSDV